MTKAALKAQNTGWIWAVVAGDALVLAAFAFPSAADQVMSLLSGARIAGASIAPVVVLSLTSLLPSDVKAMLVFWRLHDVLPGHRAFSVYTQKDPRIDVERLRATVGEFPRSPRDQNAVWYRLFKKAEADPAVSQAHRHFLLFRDLAVLSFLLGIVTPVVFYFIEASAVSVWIAVGLFTIQYIATAISARHHGVRLVCNVLALHGAADSAKAPRASRKKAA